MSLFEDGLDDLVRALVPALVTALSPQINTAVVAAVNDALSKVPFGALLEPVSDDIVTKVVAEITSVIESHL